jgi:hypothetical protein
MHNDTIYIHLFTTAVIYIYLQFLKENANVPSSPRNFLDNITRDRRGTCFLLLCNVFVDSRFNLFIGIRKYGRVMSTKMSKQLCNQIITVLYTEEIKVYTMEDDIEQRIKIIT